MKRYFLSLFLFLYVGLCAPLCGAKEDLVVVLMPTYNSAAFVAEAIKSVQDQEYSNWRLLIVDDASTDNTRKIVKEIARTDSRIDLLPLSENRGVARARNTGLYQIQTKLEGAAYIAFLDSDDLFYPSKLRRQIAFMQRYKLDYSYTNFYPINNEGQRGQEFVTRPDACYRGMLKSCYMQTCTMIFKASALGDRRFPNLPTTEDAALFTEIARSDYSGAGLLEPLSAYRFGHASLSSNKWKMLRARWKLLREHQKLNPLRAAYYFMYYAVEGTRRQVVRRLPCPRLVSEARR